MHDYPDQPPEAAISLISTRQALTPAEEQQLRGELDQLRRWEIIERRIWRGILGLFTACALAMALRLFQAWSQGALS